MSENNLTFFRMYADVQMNRPVDRDKDYISPGGYEMVMNGRSIQFDFEEYEVGFDDEDSSIIHIMGRNPDYDEFEELGNVMVSDLCNVNSITEFFIYTGEPGETDLKPVELLNCTFAFVPHDNWKQTSASKEVIKNAIITSSIEY